MWYAFHGVEPVEGADNARGLLAPATDAAPVDDRQCPAGTVEKPRISGGSTDTGAGVP
jgi:hypothetical protein